MINLRKTMSMFAAAASVVAAGSAPAMAQAAEDCPGGYFPLICRGPVDFEHNLVFDKTLTRHEVTVRFAPGVRAAGPNGETLARGACSWIDRKFRDEEAGVGRLVFENTHTDEGVAIRAAAQETMLSGAQTCNANDRCRITFCAKPGEGRFAIYNATLGVSHP
ncbi:MAG: hypothetical protein AAGJ87_17195 [Pseudomonadota bacterium]